MSHYRDDRLSPDYRFDRVETTISHLLREPHPALGGRAYGPALLDALDDAGHGPGPGGAVLEIGGGAGWLARACLQARPGLSWTSVDVSLPALRAQRARAGSAAGRERWAGLRADARRLPLRRGSWRGLVLANEVAADLPPEHGPADLVAEVARVLGPGGRAAIVEFGGDAPPTAVPMLGDLGQGDHVEHSLCFPALVGAAEDAGLRARVVPLFDLLGVDGSVRVASYTDLRRLAALVSETPMIARTEAEVRRRHPVLTRLFRFDFPRLDDRRFPDAASPTGAADAFKALLLAADDKG